MAQDFLLPDIGEGIIECELVEWLVAEGETVKEDQPVADVMTDKALVQIPSMHDGVVTRLYYNKGDIAKVHAPLFAIEPTVPVEQVTAVITPSIIDNKVEVAAELIKHFVLPDIGEGIVECEVVDWRVAVGDSIVEDQPIVDVMTDKALVQIPAMEAGVITQLFCKKGSVAQVHAPLFSYQVAAVATTTTETLVTVKDNLGSDVVSQPETGARVDRTANNKKAIASPAVRRVARELNIDLSQVNGSGKNGRIYKDDVISFNQTDNQVVENVAPVIIDAPAPASDNNTASMATDFEVSTVEPLKGIKAAMARQKVASVSTIPHFTYCEEIDMTELVALRAKLKESYQAQGVKLTMMPFFNMAMS